jgi:hypothetical protein
MAVRRVRRVIRKIDPWTVLKVSLIFNTIGGLVFTLGVWVMWSLAIQRGLPDRVTDFFANFALVFNAEGELYFRVLVLLSIIGVVMFTGLMTLGAVVYNLISDVVGGIEVIVLEETYAVAVARPAPVRPAVHMPTTAEVDTVPDDSMAAVEVVGEGDEGQSEEEEPIGWQSPATVDDDEIDEIDEIDEVDEVDVEDDTIEEDITAEGDEAPIAAASEG